MNDHEDYVPCQWPRCNLEATREIHYELESINVCAAHRAAVQVNIETQGKIWIFPKDDAVAASGPIVRPGEGEPIRRGRPRPAAGKPGVPQDWQQEAAKQADARAVEVGRVPDLVQPRKRRQGDTALSKLFGPKKLEE